MIRKKGIKEASVVIMRMKQELEIPTLRLPPQAPGPQDDDGEGPEVLKLLGRVCEQADSISPCLNPSRDC